MTRSLTPTRSLAAAAGCAAALALLAHTPVARADAPAEQRLEDRVAQVTVFSNQAQLRRVASVRLADGRHRLSFPALPDAHDPGSLRVLADGARLLGFEVVRGYGEAELPPEVRAKRERIEAIDRELALNDGQRVVIAEEIAMLTRLTTVAPTRRDDGSSPRVDAASMRKLLTWASGRLETAGDAVAALELARIELVEEREVLVSELLGTTGAGQLLQRPRVVADVLVEQARTVELTLVYRTYDARWVPAYDVRLATGSDDMQLGVNALVWQQTGEDWSDVPMAFSTAMPTQSADLPELLAWFIEETPPPPPPPPVRYDVADSTASRSAPSPPARSSRGRSRKAEAAPVADGAYYEDAEYDYGVAESLAAPADGLLGGLSGGAGYGRGGGGITSSPARDSAGVARLQQAVTATNYMADLGARLVDTSGRQSLLVGGGGGGYTSSLGAEASVQGWSTTPTYESSPQVWSGYEPASNAMGFDFRFDADRDTTIPSDGQVHKVPLGTRTLASRIEHIVVPVAEEAAFARAVVDNGSPYPMLAGVHSVFLDGGFLGQLPTPTVAPGQPLELALGIDRSVKIKRKQEQLSDKGGLFGNQKVRVYRITIELENFRDEAVQLKVLDRVPYTYDEDLKLIVGERSHEPSVDHGSGMLEWAIALGPGEKTELTFEYTLKHNKNHRVWHP